MILFKKLFTPVASMSPEEAKDYIATHQDGTFTILDVRQPGEYEEAHIPGARLIPLPQLHDSYKELDTAKPVLVHCAIGGRSRVAAQMLSGLGFQEVYNLAGGIEAFQGQKATGPQELNLSLIRGDETPAAMLVLAYGMETGLRTFYETMAAKKTAGGLPDLLQKLARIEARHQQRLFERYSQLVPGKDLATFEKSLVPEVLEGGFDITEFMKKNEPYLHTPREVLDLAMMLETQALDLYLRFADRSAQPRTRDVLFTIATEEKAHLAALGHFLDETRGQI